MEKETAFRLRMEEHEREWRPAVASARVPMVEVVHRDRSQQERATENETKKGRQ